MRIANTEKAKRITQCQVHQPIQHYAPECKGEEERDEYSRQQTGQLLQQLKNEQLVGSLSSASFLSNPITPSNTLQNVNIRFLLFSMCNLQYVTFTVNMHKMQFFLFFGFITDF